ncbi:hypothetical protein E2562_035023 [Oryza meyeriana var. granulata]|uniref:Uncharacterized protein n=1 Tax=Oryza meyeriana var. granulata TaxID=110450 RepID=A0A6G1FFJ2_9ORYZ|nr:hypothetical protein E2562_035023 [Oryza meyeriana var. granulata]
MRVTGAAWSANGKELEEVEAALLTMHINRERPDTSTAGFLCEHVTISGRYSRMAEHLVMALLPDTICLGLRLRRLEWGGTPVRLH